jgi:hypothetical protein
MSLKKLEKIHSMSRSLLPTALYGPARRHGLWSEASVASSDEIGASPPGVGNSPQFVQERFRGFQIGSLEALAELRVNSCEQIAGVVGSSLVAPKARQAGGGS